MKTLTKKSNPVSKKAPDTHFNKISMSLEKKSAYTFTAAFYKQISCSNKLPKKNGGLISVTSINYFTDTDKRKKTRSLFFEYTQKLPSNDKSRSYLENTGNAIENRQWAQDLMEQMQFLKGNPDIEISADKDMNDFCFYADAKAAS